MSRMNEGLDLGNGHGLCRDHLLGAARCGREAAPGILDISGFESFESNSLEQLLINLSASLK